MVSPSLQKEELFNYRAYARAAIAAYEAARPTPTTPTPPEGLTDERLLELAAAGIDGYDSIEPGEYEPETWIAVEAYGSELIAYARAAIAADRAARPAPTPEELTSQFRAWWAESYPNAPAGPHAVASHVAFALHLLGRGATP